MVPALLLLLVSAAPPGATADVRASDVSGGAGSSERVALAVTEALGRALTIPGARVVLDETPSVPGGCEVDGAEPLGTLAGSGRPAVRVTGRTAAGAPCGAVVFARARVLAPALVLDRAIRTGESLAGSCHVEEREVRLGHAPVTELAAGVAATRPLPAGAMLEPELVTAPGPGAGAVVPVRLQMRGLVLEQTGRAVPCGRSRACALLPTGARVEGRWTDGTLLVEVR